MNISERIHKLFSAALVSTLATITCYLFTYAYLWGQLKVFGAPRSFLALKTETLIFTALIGVILIGFITNYVLSMKGTRFLAQRWFIQFLAIFSFFFVFSYALMVISALEGIEATALYYLLITAICIVLSLLLSFVLRMGIVVLKSIHKLTNKNKAPVPSSSQENVSNLLSKIVMIFVILSISVYALGYIAGQLMALNKKSYQVIAGNPRKLIISDYKNGFVVAPMSDDVTILPIYSYVELADDIYVYHDTIKNLRIESDPHIIEEAIDALNQ